jgi:hypothetical protein
MPGKPYKKPTSQAQARLFGAAAAGKVPGFSPTEAKNKLRGVNEKALPARKGARAAPGRRKRTS